jgi:hypothetical protein
VTLCKGYLRGKDGNVRGKDGDIRAEGAQHISTFVRIKTCDRLARLDAPGTLHHVIDRNIER